MSEPTKLRPAASLPPAARQASCIFLLLIVLWACVKEACGKVTALHLARFPYNTLFLSERFPDFLLFQSRFRYFHHAEFFAYTGATPFMYPAPLGVVYELFYQAPRPLLSFLGFAILALLAAAVLFGRELHRRGLAAPIAYAFPVAVVALSMPVWFELIQSNMEIVIWIFVTAGVVLFFRRRGYSAAVCFGIAAAMKIYPVAFLGLFLIRKKYGPIVTGLAAAAATTLASLWLLGGSIGPTWAAVSDGVGKFRYFFMLQRRRELGFDHSLLGIVKTVLPKPFPSPERFAHVLTVYLACVALLGIALFFLRAWRLPVINQVIFLTVACTLLPPVSFEYTLLHMFIPLALLVLVAMEANRTATHVPGLRAAFLCLAIVLAPLSEVIAGGHELGGQIKAITLAVLLWISVTRPFPSTHTLEVA